MKFCAPLFFLVFNWTSALPEPRGNVQIDLNIVKGFTLESLSESSNKFQGFSTAPICFPLCGKHGECQDGEEWDPPRKNWCICNDNWSGTDGAPCQIPVCKTPCYVNGGKCASKMMDGKEVHYCDCNSHFQGPTCADCNIHWQPEGTCNKPLCDPACSTDGKCVGVTGSESTICECNHDWTGPACDKRACPEDYFALKHVCDICTDEGKALRFTKDRRGNPPKGDKTTENTVFYNDLHKPIKYEPSSYLDPKTSTIKETCFISSPGAMTFYCHRQDVNTLWENGKCKKVGPQPPVKDKCQAHHRWKEIWEVGDAPGHLYSESLTPKSCQDTYKPRSPATV